MTPHIFSLSAKKLVGKHMHMSLAENRTFELWRTFMPRRKEINNSIGKDLFSIQVYDESFNFRNFDPKAGFEKWAAIEVIGFSEIPNDMESFILEGGLYAVFKYKGTSSAAEKTFRNIFENWLPHSEFDLDQRPHFEILGKKYKYEDPDSEEEIWIPIKRKK